MKKISVLVVFLAVMTLLGGAGQVWAEPHDRLLPLLVNLEGWQAQPARGMSMISAQMKMISANRVYLQADKNLNVTVMVNSGPVLDSDLQEFTSDNDSVRIKTRQVDGFWVKSTHSKKNGSGQLIVYLDYNQEASGVLIANYTKITDDEALQAISLLDWAKIKKSVTPLL